MLGSIETIRIRDPLREFITTAAINIRERRNRAGAASSTLSEALTAYSTGEGEPITETLLEQLHVLVGLPSIQEGAAYRYPLYVLNALLGGTMSSRLFQKIREERGLAVWEREATEEAWEKAEAEWKRMAVGQERKVIIE